jgi:hypothetical protein
VLEREGIGQRRVLAEEPQRAAPVQSLKFFEEASTEQSRQHPHRQEEPGPTRDPLRAIGREATAALLPKHQIRPTTLARRDQAMRR